jgi:hypothetical protein
MNVRFSATAVRCRIAHAELDELLSGRALTLEVPLPRNHQFRFNVRPAALGDWQLDSDPTGLWLTIPRRQLEALSQQGLSKEGIEHAFDTSEGKRVRVCFEVDLADRA